MKKYCEAIALAVVFFLAPVRAEAIPTLQSASKTVDDAKVTLIVPTQAIRDDMRTFCEVEVEVKGDIVELTAGDTVNIAVYEAAFFVGDAFADEIFQTVFNVTVQEVQSNLVQRTFDCSGDFKGDGDTNLEVYARLSVEKAACGWTCFQDTAATPRMDVTARMDDDREANNLQSQAAALPMGATAGYIARDEDWYALSIDAPSRILLDAVHRPASGALTVALRAADGQMVSPGVPTETGNVVQFEPLLPGTYAVQIAPEVAEDFVFYALNVTLEGISSECEIGAVDRVPCGNCGTKSRSCEGGFWGTFGECSDEGVCAPGETDTTGCGACGQRVDRCSSSCQWVAGACADDCAEGTAVLGEACRSTVNCVAGLSCLTEAEYPAFVGGYCSETSCTEGASCTGGGLCAQVFGRNFCLEPCSDDAECRVGYDCIETSAGRTCAPRCTGDADCGDPSAPVCDVPSGTCVAGEPGGQSGTGGLSRAEADETGGVVVDSGGCAATPGTPWFVLAGLALLRRRRR